MWFGILVIAGIGILLLLRGWRGHIVGDHPYCRHCGFDLFGLPVGSVRCSECGAFVTGIDATYIGLRRPQLRLIAIGLLLLLASLSIGIWRASRVATYIKFSPPTTSSAISPLTQTPPLWLTVLKADVDELIEWAEYGKGDAKSSALNELTNRLRAGLLSDDAASELVDYALALQLDYQQPWDGNWGSVVEYVQACGKLSDEKLHRYLSNGFRVGFSCPAQTTHARGLDFAFLPAERCLAYGTRYSYRISEKWTLSGIDANPYYRTPEYRIVYVMNCMLSGSRVDDGNSVFAALKPGPHKVTVQYIIEVFDSEAEARDYNNSMGDHVNRVVSRAFKFTTPFNLLPAN